MAAQFGTSTEVMGSAAQHVHQVRERIQQQLGTLRSQLGPLEGTWRGDASLAFSGLMVRWNDDAQRINRALAAIGDSVASSGRDYRAVETENAGGATRITGALG